MKWTKEAILEIAGECKNRSEFNMKHNGAKCAAIRLGIEDDVFKVIDGEKYGVVRMTELEKVKLFHKGYMSRKG